MTAVVSSSTAATYVAPAAAASEPAATDSAQQGDSNAPSAAATVANTANLAPDTVAALVAQQTTDASATTASATPSSPSSTTPASSAPTSTDDVFAGASDLVLQVQHYASLLVDGSGASDTDKANALAQLYQLRFKVGGSATDPSSDDWFTQSTAAQRQVVNAEIDNSSFFKQGNAAASQFNAAGISLARAGDRSAASSEFARFSQLSTQQQTLIWGGGFSQFQSLDDFKSYLAQQAAGNAAMQASINQSDAAQAATSPSKTGADQALDALTPAATDDPVTKAAKSLLTAGPGVSMADVALTVLQNSAAAQAKAKADADATDKPGRDGTDRAKTSDAGSSGSASGEPASTTPADAPASWAGVTA